MRILIFFLFLFNFSYAQYWGGQEVTESDLSPWLQKFQIEYAGIYHFGESEGESDFYLFFSGDYIIGQVKNGYWEESTSTLKSNYINLTNIKIDKEGKFTSDQHTGQFVKYKSENGKLYKSLKIDNPWASWIENSKFEIGTRTEIILEEIYYGKYTEASFKKLKISELNKMGTDELTIMKNEIYARYGYIFIKNGKMDTYFKNQYWYRAQHKNVNNFITKIELHNIESIKKME